MSSWVCLDTSVVVKLLVPEEGSDAAEALVRSLDPEYTLVAPAFAWAEVGSVLAKKVRQGKLRPERADFAWERFLALQIVFIHSPGLMRKSWVLAGELSLPTLYDAAFLAVAEEAPDAPCPLWTADQTLVNLVRTRKPYVRHLGELAAS